MPPAPGSDERSRTAAAGYQPLLEVRGVGKRFGGVLANDQISLSVPRVALEGVIGPNGSGKTTLLNGISSQSPPDGGEIRFEGRTRARHAGRLGTGAAGALPGPGPTAGFGQPRGAARRSTGPRRLPRRRVSDGHGMPIAAHLRQGMGFADIGYALVGGRVVAAGAGLDLLDDPALGRFFVGR